MNQTLLFMTFIKDFEIQGNELSKAPTYEPLDVISGIELNQNYLKVGSIGEYALYKGFEYDKNRLVLGEFGNPDKVSEDSDDEFLVYGIIDLVPNRAPKVISNRLGIDLREVMDFYMPYKLYLDDLRDPKLGEFKILRTSSFAIEYMIKKVCPDFISFDHDLGGDDTAMLVVKWMIHYDLDLKQKFIPHYFKFNVHSANPVGSANIHGLLEGYLKSRV